jgi:hypothetical protein
VLRPSSKVFVVFTRGGDEIFVIIFKLVIVSKHSFCFVWFKNKFTVKKPRYLDFLS